MSIQHRLLGALGLVTREDYDSQRRQRQLADRVVFFLAVANDAEIAAEWASRQVAYRSSHDLPSTAEMMRDIAASGTAPEIASLETVGRKMRRVMRQPSPMSRLFSQR